MYIQIRKARELPTIQKQSTYPAQYIIHLVSENKKAKLKLKKDALRLLEHIDMVKEARKLYSKGKIISWDEFTKNESR